eukprot:168306_1
MSTLVTISNMLSETNEHLLKSSLDNDDSTTVSSHPSESDSACDESSSLSLDGSQRQGRKKFVRFSLVQTREFNVVTELAPPDSDEFELPRKSLGWDYTEREIDIETHLDEVKRGRKDKYLSMIQSHIDRVEQEKEEKEKLQQQQAMNKKKGFKSRVLKPLWKGFIEAGSRSALVISNPAYY